MEEKIEQLKKIVEKSQKIVFFGGAGVSTESGIPDFRSVDGLYNQKWAYPPEGTVLQNPGSDTFPHESHRLPVLLLHNHPDPSL